MEKDDGKRPRLSRFDIVCFIAVFFMTLVIQDFWVGAGHFETMPYSEFRALLSWILPTALFIVAWMFRRKPMASGGAGGPMGAGSSRAPVGSETDIKVTPELGQVACEAEAGSFLVGQVRVWRPQDYSDRTAAAIDEAVRKLIDEAFATARDILERHKALLDAEATHLPEKETLGPSELEGLAASLRIDHEELKGPALIAGLNQGG